MRTTGPRALAPALLTLLTAVPVVAQETAPVVADDYRAEVRVLTHIEPKSVPPNLRRLGVDFSAPEGSRRLVLLGPPDKIAAVLELLDQIDVPAPRPHAAELTFHLLQAVVGESTAAATEGSPSGPEDPRFRRLDTLVLRVVDGSAGQVAGMVRIGDEDRKAAIQFGRAAVGPGAGPAGVVLKGFQFTAQAAALRSDVDLAAGRTTLVGRASPGPGEPPLFLLATCRLDS